jgi:hypothetical protein
VEDTLVKDRMFALPVKKVVKRKLGSIQYVVVDVTEILINRPKEGQKAYDSRKKALDVKTQVLLEQNSLEIIDMQEAKGSEHDFKVSRNFFEVRILWRKNFVRSQVA